MTVTSLGGGRVGNADQVPAAVKVAVAPRRVARTDGVSGLVFRVTGGPGAVRVRLDYSKFARNFGGSWASRLKLVELAGLCNDYPRGT